ncbi:ABC transporter-like protein [Mesorhizobium amorphae CCNWGS0123]|uniref:ABC transporter-like protein n=2 Tax=Mesorhizobium amorphae TaxID=71433 RepID=G6YJM0_9HYPH|nr:ABC transporter-like protein [Mesorhizobium amorphae CCNWGS0123]
MNASSIQGTNPGMNDAILQVDHLSMKFGGLVAIGDLSFTARRGEITALIGPNGAGKTTVFNCITGFYKPSEGMITLNRNAGSSYLLERLPNHEIPARAMTLLENLLVAQHNKLMKASGYTILGLFGFSSYRKASAESVELTKHWLEKADLVDRADDPAGDLPYGAQRRLEIARAMCTGPELLCLEEPAAGLNPKESAALNALLMDIKSSTLDPPDRARHVGGHADFRPRRGARIRAQLRRQPCHLTWDDKPMRDNEGTFFEIAGVYRHYTWPISRTVYLGKPSETFLNAEKMTLEGMEAGLAVRKPGAKAEDIAIAFCDVLERYGIKKENRVGYSVGCAYPPDWGQHTMSLRRGDMTELQPGMTFHFMTGLWMEDWGFEMTETLLITETGMECLANVPRKLFVKN